MTKRRIIIILFIALLVTVVTLWIIISLINKPKNIINLSNYDSTVKNLSPDYKESILMSVYNIVSRNNKDSKINDAIIREGSASQTYDSENKYFKGGFIVDIPSLKQSYQVQYIYSPSGDKMIEGGNPIQISCLPKNKLIYAEFACKDSSNYSNNLDDLSRNKSAFKIVFNNIPGTFLTESQKNNITLKLYDFVRNNVGSKISTVTMEDNCQKTNDSDYTIYSCSVDIGEKENVVLKIKALVSQSNKGYPISFSINYGSYSSDIYGIDLDL